MRALAMQGMHPVLHLLSTLTPPPLPPTNATTTTLCLHHCRPTAWPRHRHGEGRGSAYKMAFTFPHALLRITPRSPPLPFHPPPLRPPTRPQPPRLTLQHGPVGRGTPVVGAKMDESRGGCEAPSSQPLRPPGPATPPSRRP